MTTLLRPSALLTTGLRTQTIGNLNLFKFTDELGNRLQELLDRNKMDQLTPAETIDFEAEIA